MFKYYLARILGELNDLNDSNGLYQFIGGTRVIFFGLEGILNDAINLGTLPLGMTLDGMDLKTLKPMLVKLLNQFFLTPISETDTLDIDQLLTILGYADPGKLLSLVGIDGLGSRHAALGEAPSEVLGSKRRKPIRHAGPQTDGLAGIKNIGRTGPGRRVESLGQ